MINDAIKHQIVSESTPNEAILVHQFVFYVLGAASKRWYHFELIRVATYIESDCTHFLGL